MHLLFEKSRAIWIFVGVSVTATMIGAIWVNSNRASEFRSEIKGAILKELANGRALPRGKVVDTIYILGGSERSLRYKFRTAAELYKSEVANKVLILSRPGTTRFSQELGRNYTSDEWSIDQLEKLGVRKEDIETIKIDHGFFGTFSEAKHISELVRERGYTSILLICQVYHTRRVQLSFQNFLPSRKVSFYIQNSSDSQTLFETIIEFMKLKVYECWLLR
jgi:uncharacterized SAM-binding protein YcdF (DUF218 family)